MDEIKRHGQSIGFGRFGNCCELVLPTGNSENNSTLALRIGKERQHKQHHGFSIFQLFCAFGAEFAP
jgi:hypothetical protein